MDKFHVHNCCEFNYFLRYFPKKPNHVACELDSKTTNFTRLCDINNLNPEFDDKYSITLFGYSVINISSSH